MTEIIVGEGGFGKVTCCIGKDIYAKKYVKGHKQFIHEVGMMHMVQGVPGVMPLLGVDVAKQAIRMPYIRMGLYEYATSMMNWTHPKKRISIARRIMRRIMRIVGDLHDIGVVHLDIKPDNILLEQDPSSSVPRPIIADFGVSRRVGTELDAEQGVGTPGFIAPEVFAKDYTVGPLADVYSLGKTLEIIVGEPRSKPLSDIIAKMCQTDPDKRITLRAALKHPFFRSSRLPECFTPSV